MSVYNRYIITMVVAACVCDVALAFAGQNDISLYFTVNVIAFLAVTLLYVYLNPRARAALNVIGISLFGIFMVIVAIKVVEILTAT